MNNGWEKHNLHLGWQNECGCGEFCLECLYDMHMKGETLDLVEITELVEAGYIVEQQQ